MGFWVGVMVAAVAGAPATGDTAVVLKIQGSSTVNPVVAEAAEIFRREKGWTITVDTQGGSSGGIAAVAEGDVDIGMSSRPVSDEDRARYPRVTFYETTIGLDGVALAVSRPVYEAGVHALSREEVRALYEGRIRNWKDLGGPDAPVVFYNKEPGRGTWEVFADWAYEGHANAPFVSLPEVGGNEEARSKVSHHPSAITLLSYAWVESSEQLMPLGIRRPDGRIVRPGTQTIHDGSYPMARQLRVITTKSPQGPVKTFLDFLVSSEGQALVVKHGYLSLQPETGRPEAGRSEAAAR